MRCERSEEPGAESNRRPRGRRSLRGSEADWRTVDRALRTLRRRRGRARTRRRCTLLREAEALQIWRPLGMVSPWTTSSVCSVMGAHGARTGLRVARVLGDLPRLNRCTCRR